MQEKGEVAEEELRAIEEDITGRVSQAFWIWSTTAFDSHPSDYACFMAWYSL